MESKSNSSVMVDVDVQVNKEHLNKVKIMCNKISSAIDEYLEDDEKETETVTVTATDSNGNVMGNL